MDTSIDADLESFQIKLVTKTSFIYHFVAHVRMLDKGLMLKRCCLTPGFKTVDVPFSLLFVIVEH